MREDEEEAKSLAEAIRRAEVDLKKLAKEYDQHVQRTAQNKKDSERVKGEEAVARRDVHRAEARKKEEREAKEAENAIRVAEERRQAQKEEKQRLA